MNDPAFLFYDGDAAKDVSHMNRIERGCYFDIIQAQRKFGKMTKKTIKKVLGKDFDNCWDSLELILTYDNDMYYISWLQNSIIKRKEYSESRRKNRQKKESIDNKNIKSKHIKNISKTYDIHMENENENENINISKDDYKFKKERFLNFFKELNSVIIEDIITSFKQENININESEIREFAIRFSLKKVADDDFYNLPKTYLTHFNNWLRIEILKVKKPITKNIIPRKEAKNYILYGKKDEIYWKSEVDNKFVEDKNGEIITLHEAILIFDPKAEIK